MKSFFEYLDQQIKATGITYPVAYFLSEMGTQIERKTDSIGQVIKGCENILQGRMPNLEGENPMSTLITKRHILFLCFGFHFDARTCNQLLREARAGYLYPRHPYDLALIFSLDHNYSITEFKKLQKKCEKLAGVDDCFYPFATNVPGSSKSFSLQSLEEFTSSCEDLEEVDKSVCNDSISTITERLQNDLDYVKTPEDLLYVISKNCGFFRKNHERAIRILAKHFQDYLHANIPFAAECYYSSKETDILADCDHPLWPIGQIKEEELLKDDSFYWNFLDSIATIPIEMVETNRQIDRWLGGYPYIEWNTSDWYIRSADTGLRGIFTGQVQFSRSTFLSYIAFFTYRVRMLKQQRRDGSFIFEYPSLAEYESDCYPGPNTDETQINKELIACGFAQLNPDLYPEDKLFSAFFRDEEALFLDLYNLDLYNPETDNFLPLIDFEEDKYLGRASKVFLRS